MTAKKQKNSTELGLTKLKSSGLDAKDAEMLGMSIIDRTTTAKLHPSFKPLVSLKLAYFDHNGKPLPDWPGAPPFYRLRYLEKMSDFAALAKGKETRYVQPPNTAPVAYWPKNFKWSGFVNDPDQPLIITEGELKAAKACKEGFPTLGLGGVWNWRSHRFGLEWLPSLEPMNWLRRNVYICFDSDLRTNTNVCTALVNLSEQLVRRGAVVHLVSLPDLPDLPKVGLDDFLVNGGASANDRFRKLLSEAEPLGLTKPLFELNNKYVYVQNPGLILVQKTGFKTSPTAFRDHLESTTNYEAREIKKDGSISFRSVSAAAAWLKWPLRTEVSRLTYNPGESQFIDEQNGQRAWNIWPGWGIEPAAGDVAPFLQLVDHLFTGADEAAKTWFLRWCAWPLQYPGTKMFSSAVIHGIKHGTGKSLVGYTLGRIYGKNFTEISQRDLHNSFNEWAEGKQFIMGDDVTGSNKRADADFLKKIITQLELRVNGKYVPTYTVPDCINYYFTANHPDSFFLEDDDRRMFIHEVIVGALPEEFYVEYNLWLDTGGAAAVFQYLLDLDLGDFNPAAPAYRTAAKERMTMNMQSDLASWVRQLLAVPDHVLKIGEVVIAKDLFTSKELLDLYDPAGRTGTTANGLGRELARAGVIQVLEGRPVRGPDGSQGRFYAVRNQDQWRGASADMVLEHIRKTSARGTGSKY